MEKTIYKYLTEYFYVSTTEVGNDGIYRKEDIRRFKTPIYGDKLINEIVTVFGLESDYIKKIINDWAKQQKSDINLEFYWLDEQNIFSLTCFPNIINVTDRSLSMELTPVKPITLPNETLFHLDNKINKEQHKNIFKEKVNRFFKYIYSRIFGVFKN